jgi:hypothetical protein
MKFKNGDSIKTTDPYPYLGIVLYMEGNIFSNKSDYYLCFFPGVGNLRKHKTEIKLRGLGE